MVTNKYQKLLDTIKQSGRALVALSGGCDSALLAYSAREALGAGVLAVTVDSPFFPAEEKERALRLTRMFSIEHRIIDLGEAQLEAIKENPHNRCYVCKTMLFSRLRELAAAAGYPTVFDGSNVDDQGQYRPGLQALAELNIKSPLKEAGLTKEEIRELSTRFGLPTAKTPSLSCLATRFPYGSRITREKLKMLEKAEAFLREQGFTQLRVRLHDTIARIEVVPAERKKFFNEEKMDRIAAAFKSIGFDYTALDLSGYISGSMDLHIEK